MAKSDKKHPRPAALDDQAVGMNREVRVLNKTNKVLAGTVFVLVIAVVVLAAALWGAAEFQPKPRYIAVTDDLRFVDLPNESKPTINREQVKGFVERCVRKTLAFDFLNWREQLNEASTECFTSEGAAALARNMKSSGGILELIQEERRTSSAALQGSATITKAGRRGSTLAYEVTVPMVHQMANNQDTIRNERLVRVVVVRDNTKALHRGVGISQFSLEVR